MLDSSVPSVNEDIGLAPSIKSESEHILISVSPVAIFFPLNVQIGRHRSTYPICIKQLSQRLQLIVLYRQIRQLRQKH